MKIRPEIIRLIDEEQVRQDGQFLEGRVDFFRKISDHAEIISHELRGVCCGFAFFYCNDPKKYASYITLVLVSPEFRSCGIGRALVGYVMLLTSQRGFHCCRLEVVKKNVRALRMYESMGFRLIEDRGEKLLLEAEAK